ncbi:molybdopterin synthase catalytic subunit [Devosia pacifica]|uniref:Molybdopterin synthase catalytic subunit n=1 Tax=Devosia pacifica TaxID=1335967 RepID=A0A918VRM8_9HYPH|nr:molybdenum cofactor biosynthesis protein MoaE [Devosia pacifica]GHA17182.1 molybdopterin synthase catalytic subunit [Devosia pacifica]
MSVEVITGSFDPGAAYSEFLAGARGIGAGVVFTGVVRSTHERPITALILECYVELATNEIEAIRRSAVDRFALAEAHIIHRHGRLLPGEPIMQVMTLAEHRGAAFDGAQYLMDYLKTDAPFWKKEETADGSKWVEPVAADAVARLRWEQT